MAYCGYVRRSRLDYEAERLSHEDTLARQRGILTDLAHTNHHTLSRIYEEVVSGDSISSRPQMQHLIADILAGKWQGVYVTAIDRLARGDTSDQGYLMRVLQVSGVKVYTPTRILDPLNPDDETNVEFSLFLARQEYKASTRRQQAGRKRSREEGKYVGSKAAYGYRRYKLPTQRGYSLSICEEEAAIVRQIGSWYLYGLDGQPMGLTAIASRLTDMGVPPGENAKVWSASRIHRMLTNPVYIGVNRWGYEKVERTVSVSGVEKRRVIHNDCELTPAMHQPIWTQEMFESIQRKLNGYSQHKHLPVRKGAVLSNPLAGLVVCGECGHVMSHLPASGHQPAILKCRTRGCPTVQSYRAPVEETVLSVMRQWLDDAGRMSAPDASPNSEPETSALDGMKAERSKLLRQIDRLQDLLEQEVYTVQQYTDRYAKLESRLDDLNLSIHAEEQRIASRPVYCHPAEIKPALVRLLDSYSKATAQQKNDMLKSCISSIVYRKYNPGVVVKGHTYSDPNAFEIDIYPILKK